MEYCNLTVVAPNHDSVKTKQPRGLKASLTNPQKM